MVAIRRVASEFILGVSRELYPREFLGLLRMEDKVITEILILPQTVWGEGFAQYMTYHMPYDSTVVGSVHSHPSSDATPSRQDIIMFSKTGELHIIARHPFADISDLICYDRDGTIRTLELVDDGSIESEDDDSLEPMDDEK